MSKKFLGSSEGLTILHDDGEQQRITNESNTGIMPIGVKGAWLSDNSTNVKALTSEALSMMGSTVVAADAGTGDNFGISCSLSSDGSMLAIGAYTWDGTAINQGKVYLYTISGSTVTPLTTVVAADAGASDYFGFSCSLSSDGSMLVVGTNAWDGTATNQGTVYFSDGFVSQLKTATGFDNDRSNANKQLLTQGTIEKESLGGTGSLVAYSGFSASNYLSQAVNTDLDFSTGTFWICGWIKESANSAIETILERDSTTTAQRISLQVSATGMITFACDDDTTARVSTGVTAIDNDVWTFIVCTYSAGTLNLYQNGVLNDTETGAALLTLSNATAIFNVAVDADAANPLTNGSLINWRIGSGSLTAAQIKSIYEEERPMIVGAQPCVLGGDTDVVDMSYDKLTGKIHTLDGTGTETVLRNGIQVDYNTGTDNHISASDGVVVKGA